MRTASPPAPPRALGLWGAVALVVGNQLGTGVFTLPASLAPYGWNAVAGWIATIAGALALAHVFGRLSVKVPGSGGPHAYTRAAFGEGAGFVVAWSYWMNQWVGNAGIGVRWWDISRCSRLRWGWTAWRRRWFPLAACGRSRSST